MKQLIECVPNFSEGRDMAIIKQITDQIETVEGIRLLDVDPGAATNRTVVTFVGEPEPVCEAAFRAIAKAAQLIDMRRHKGEHPRMGATDVCPLVPVAGITMDETVQLARNLAERVGRELNISVFCYESAALKPERRNLAAIRAGEYEGMAEKLAHPDWQPDFGPSRLDPRAGVTAIGARDFLVAYNVNLNTTSTRRANAIAFDVREKGRPKREGHPLTGPVARDAAGQPVMIPGILKAVKGIGWFIPEYGIAQISMNLTNISVTPVHIAFDEVCRKAEARGVRITGSEIVGLIPLKAMLDAGKHYLRKQKRSLGVSEKELVKIAVKSMGLDDLKPFRPEEKIIEYRIAETGADRLMRLSCRDFADETASESPAPGGGSISAYVGALGVSLGAMVANLSAHKRGWDERWEEFSVWAEKGQRLKDELLALVDEDTRSFNRIMTAFGLPQGTEAEKEARREAIEEATQHATRIPFQVMEKALQSMEIIQAMAEKGLKASASDAGVGALCARTAVLGAYLNVRINAAGLDDRRFAEEMIRGGQELADRAQSLEDEILNRVSTRIG